MTTIRELASQLYDALETKRRDNGDLFVCLKNESPEWMTDLCRAAHDSGNMFPDDFRYSLIKEAAGAVHDAGDRDLDEVADEFADAVEVYTSALCAWAASHSYRSSYCDDAMVEYGKPESLSQLLMWGQATERREVFDSVLSSLRGLADDESEGEGEEA